MKPIAKIQIFFVISFICAGFFSCDPNEELPPETILEYRGCQEYRDSTNTKMIALNLQIHFQDGDGNIGTDDWETDNNLFVHVLDKQLDTFVPMQSPDTAGVLHDIVYGYKIPVLSTDKSSIKGMFDVGISQSELEFMPLFSKQGIIRFEIYMYDRNNVKSNTVRSSDISIQ